MLIPTAKLDIINGDFQTCMAEYMSLYVSEKKKGNPCEHLIMSSNYLLWAVTVIGDWQQNIDGSTTGKVNYISQPEFYSIINLGQQLCNRI
jgi:hypothetical protein